MESALQSSSESGLSEVDNSTIFVEVGAKEKKHTDTPKASCYKIAKYTKDQTRNQAAISF